MQRIVSLCNTHCRVCCGYSCPERGPRALDFDLLFDLISHLPLVHSLDMTRIPTQSPYGITAPASLWSSTRSIKSTFLNLSSGTC
jgi:hypothetical protein